MELIQDENNSTTENIQIVSLVEVWFESCYFVMYKSSSSVNIYIYICIELYIEEINLLFKKEGRGGGGKIPFQLFVCLFCLLLFWVCFGILIVVVVLIFLIFFFGGVCCFWGVYEDINADPNPTHRNCNYPSCVIDFSDVVNVSGVL